MSQVTAVIAAAGQGTRMGSAVNKQLLHLAGRPVLAVTLEVFQHCPEIQEIIVVASAEEISSYRRLVREYGLDKVSRLVLGGAQRQESVARGLAQLQPECDLVAVHDGARPLLLAADLARVLPAAATVGAALLGVPVKDTLKVVDGAGFVAATPDRSSLWAVQTPQVFRKSILLQAHARAAAEGFLGTDESALVERCGYPVQVVRGSYENIKITTPEDLILAEGILRRRKVDAQRTGL